MDYFNIYLKRLNRYGLDYQSRIQNMRERNFDLYLLKTVYLVSFWYNNELIKGSLEPYKQDETKILQYLLVKRDVVLPNGTIFSTEDETGKKNWMVYWLEDIKASGYNKYVVLRMTHSISWIGRDKKEHSTLAYMYGQEDNMLKNELRSRSRMDTLYNENLKMSFLVIPTNEYIKKEDYLEVGTGALLEAYVVTGYDINSTPGVEYVTIDPCYTRDHSPNPTPSQGEEDEYYWIDNFGG